MEIEEAVAVCRASIIKGSKSFSLAAQLFPKEIREAAFCLYGWCRRCDDEIDSAGGDPNARLQLLKEQTAACYTRAPLSDPIFLAFRYIVDRYKIPQHYPFELLEGMAMDTRGDTIETWDDLRRYCYRVAGTVGLMMSHIMGLRNERALKNACDLGLAMQLTNIARDIREDYELGRVYLPRTWLKERGMKASNLLDPDHRSDLVFLVKRLLSEADGLYGSGDEGLKALSFRMALSISSARRIYSEIGRRVLQCEGRAWDHRCYVPLTRKWSLIVRGALPVLASVPWRLGNPWRPKPIMTLWRFE